MSPSLVISVLIICFLDFGADDFQLNFEIVRNIRIIVNELYLVSG